MSDNPKIQDLLSEEQILRLKDSLEDLAAALTCEPDYEETEHTPISVKIAHARAKQKTINSLFTQLTGAPLWNAARQYYLTYNDHLNTSSKIKLVNIIPAIQRYNNHGINWIKVCQLLGLVAYGHGITKVKGNNPKQAKIIVGWTQYDTNQFDLYSKDGSFWQINPYNLKYKNSLPYPYAPPRFNKQRRY